MFKFKLPLFMGNEDFFVKTISSFKQLFYTAFNLKNWIAIMHRRKGMMTKRHWFKSEPSNVFELINNDITWVRVTTPSTVSRYQNRESVSLSQNISTFSFFHTKRERSKFYSYTFSVSLLKLNSLLSLSAIFDRFSRKKK